MDFITLRLLGRTLDPKERSIVADSLQKITATFSSNPEAAASLISTGASPVDHEIEKADLATWTLVTSQILNLDEAVTR
jgi:hypothetical protein